MLTKLTELILRGNQLSGSIPLEIVNCTTLETLALYQNNLVGGLLHVVRQRKQRSKNNNETIKIQTNNKENHTEKLTWFTINVIATSIGTENKLFTINREITR